MAHFYDDSPELARAYNLPEVYNPPDSPTLNHSRSQSQSQSQSQRESHHPPKRHISQAQHLDQRLQTDHQLQHPQQEWSPLHSNPSALLPLPLSLPPPLPPKQPATPIQQDELPYGSARQGQTLDSSAPSPLHHYAKDPRGSRPSYPPGPRGHRRHGALLRGGSRLVLILSILCAVLGVAVVGLAAGTGVVAGRYADTSVRLESLSSSYSSLESQARTAAPTATGTAAAPTATSFSSVTKGCSDSDEKTTGTRFVSKFFERPSFTMFCNSDTQNAPLTALFAGNFDMCMEACGSWNYYTGINNFTSPDCTGVTFVPIWLNLTKAAADNAAGNCFLKPRLNRTLLTQPAGGIEVHSALLEDRGGSDSRDKRNVPVLVSLL